MLLELLPKELSPETIIHIGGVTLLLVVVFFETGIFFGFFLPGDSLLFTAGIMCDGPYLSLPPKRYVDLTQEYFQKYGMMAFVFGRFIPIVRTFLPILAGIARIDVKKFWIYNLLGATLWVATVVTAGYLLGRRFENLKDNIGLIAIIMIFISMLPLAISVLRKQMITRQEKAK